MCSESKRKNYLLIPSILLILIVTLTPGDGTIAGNYLDKVVHFIIFLILSLNINYKYQNKTYGFELMLWAIIFGLTTEVVQQYIPGRNMDLYDGIADSFGIIIGYYLYKTFPKKTDYLFQKLGT